MAVMGTGDEADVTDTSDYYDLWEAFVTVRGMCVRYGKTGVMSGLGREGRLSLLVQPYLSG